MTIECKHNFDDEVYVVFKEDDGLVRIFKDKVSEISYSKKHGLNYYVGICEDFKEEELIPINKPDLLIERINKLLSEEVDNENN